MAILLMVPEDLRERDNGKYSLSRRILKNPPAQTVDKALLLQGFAIVGTAFLI